MIKTREDLQSAILADQVRYRKDGFHFYYHFIYSETFQMFHYMKILRLWEYHINNDGIVHKFLRSYYYAIHRRLSLKYGITIAPNTVEPGFLLQHPGFRRIGPSSHIGKNCTILPNVLLGKKHSGDTSIQIGDNCYIGVGATILGPVQIGDNVIIGAGAVVVQNVPDNAIVGGVPARIIKHRCSEDASGSIES